MDVPTLNFKTGHFVYWCLLPEFNCCAEIVLVAVTVQPIFMSFVAISFALKAYVASWNFTLTGPEQILTACKIAFPCLLDSIANAVSACSATSMHWMT